MRQAISYTIFIFTYFIIQVITIVNIIIYYVFIFFVLALFYTYFCCMIEGANGHTFLADKPFSVAYMYVQLVSSIF